MVSKEKQLPNQNGQKEIAFNPMGSHATGSLRQLESRFLQAACGSRRRKKRRAAQVTNDETHLHHAENLITLGRRFPRVR